MEKNACQSQEILVNGETISTKLQLVIYRKRVAFAHSLRDWEVCMNTPASGLLASWHGRGYLLPPAWKHPILERGKRFTTPRKFAKFRRLWKITRVTRPMKLSPQDYTSSEQLLEREHSWVELPARCREPHRHSFCWVLTHVGGVEGVFQLCNWMGPPCSCK